MHTKDPLLQIGNILKYAPMPLLKLLNSLGVSTLINVYLDVIDGRYLSYTCWHAYFLLNQRGTLNNGISYVCSTKSDAVKQLFSVTLIDYFILYGDKIYCDTNLLYTRTTFNLKHSTSTGWSLISYSVISKGICILPYYGEYINTSETIRRQRQYDAERINYILTTREHTRDSYSQHGDNTSQVVLRTNIDATMVGGIARLLLYFDLSVLC